MKLIVFFNDLDLLCFIVLYSCGVTKVVFFCWGGAEGTEYVHLFRITFSASL